MSAPDVQLSDIPFWVNGLKINPDFATLPGANPLLDMLNGIRNSVVSFSSGVASANDAKRQTIDKAQEFLTKFNENKNIVRDNIIGTVGDYASDLSNTGAKFIIPLPFYGGLSAAREGSIQYLSSAFAGAPEFSESTYVSSFAFIGNIGADLINAIKLLMSLSMILNGKTDATINTISDIIYNPLISPIVNLISNNEPLISGTGYNDTISSFDDSIKETFSTAGGLLGFSQDTKEVIKDLWDNSIFKDVSGDINSPDPTGSNTALGGLLSSIKENADKPLELFSDGIPNPLDSLVRRLNSTSTDFTKTPYDTWFNMLTIGDLFPGIKDISDSAIKMAGEIASGLDFGTNGIQNGLQFVNNLSEFAAGAVSDVSTGAVGLIDNLKTDLNIINFDTFIVPPMQGGLERLRYVYSEWLNGFIPNAPQYNPDSLTVMVIVVFGMPTNSNLGLTNLGKVFNINIV